MKEKQRLFHKSKIIELEKGLVVARCSGLERKERWVTRGNVKGPCGDGNGLYLDCIRAGVLVVIPHCRFASCCHWGDCVKDIQLLSVLFLTTAVNLQLSQVKKINRKKTLCPLFFIKNISYLLSSSG